MWSRELEDSAGTCVVYKRRCVNCAIKAGIGDLVTLVVVYCSELCSLAVISAEHLFPFPDHSNGRWRVCVDGWRVQ